MMLTKGMLVATAVLLVVMFLLSVITLDDDDFSRAVAVHQTHGIHKRNIFHSFFDIADESTTTQSSVTTIESELYSLLHIHDDFASLLVCRQNKDQYEVQLYTMQLSEFFARQDISWRLHRTDVIPGHPDLFVASSKHDTVAIIYLTAVGEDAEYTLRLYSMDAPDIPYENFHLPGSLPVNAIAISDQMIAYSRLNDNHVFRTLVPTTGHVGKQWIAGHAGPNGKPAQALGFLDVQDGFSVLTGIMSVLNSMFILFFSTLQSEQF